MVIMNPGKAGLVFQQLAKVAISPNPSNSLSAVTRVKSNTKAVAARKPSVGSWCARFNSRAISWVSGASRKGAVALAIHSPRSPCRRILPLARRVRASQVLIGDSHSSAEFVSLKCTLRPRRFASCRLQSQNVGVQQHHQSRSAFHSFSSLAGLTISPMISILHFIDPRQYAGASAEGGMISATGFPKRVTRSGFLVFCTCWSEPDTWP